MLALRNLATGVVPAVMPPCPSLSGTHFTRLIRHNPSEDM